MKSRNQFQIKKSHVPFENKAADPVTKINNVTKCNYIENAKRKK